MLFEHTCSIQRNKALGSNGRHSMAVVASSVRSLFLPMSAQAETRAGLPIGRNWQVFFKSGTDVRLGDKLLHDGGSFTVNSVRPYKTRYSPHVEVLAQREAD